MQQKFLSLVVVFFVSISSIFAQEGWEAGFWAGGSQYFGDLNTTFKINTPHLAGGVAARYNFNERLGLKFAAGATRISADDANSGNDFERARNLNFESQIVDMSVGFEFNFLPYVHGSRDQFFTPYLFAGLAGFYFDPQAEYQDEMYSLRELGTEGQFKGEEYYSITGAYNYGIGLKVDLSYRVSLNFELAMRSTFTDYLDDVSTVYTDNDDLRRLRGDVAAHFADPSIIIPGINEGNLGDAGRQRGDSTNNDSYGFLTVSLMYYFGDLKCPDVSSRRF